MIRILLADDHKVLREEIKIFLSANPEIEVVGEASDGQETVSLAGKLKPDIVLMDIQMPVLSGLAATAKIKELHPQIKVLALSQHDSIEYLWSVVKAGGEGYVLKETASSELLWAIKTVSEGMVYLSPAMIRSFAREKFEAAVPGAAPEADLSPRETEVLKHLAEGLSNQEIADLLSISVKTVQVHRYHIMEKLGVHNRTELVRYAIRKGMISP